MSEREMEDFERRAMDAANDIIAQLLGTKVPARGRSRYAAHFYEAPDQRRFYYTPWKDLDGNYWTWVMKPFGRGARSGNAKRWKLVGKKVRARKRKTAKARACTRYQNWLSYLRQDWRNE